MPLANNREQREHDKFLANSNGDASIRTNAQLADESGNDLITNNSTLGISDILNLIGEDKIPNCITLFKIGYNPAITTTEEDLWSAGGTYVFPTAEMGMEVVSSNNTQDIGTVIKGDATGDTVTADEDSTTILLQDDDVDFTSATAVAVGDCVIIDPHGNPAWGYVTGVETHTLTLAGGISDGSSMSEKPYAVIDKSASTNAQAVITTFLDSDYVQHKEIIVLNGTTAVATINTDIFRINDFTMITGGSNCKALGNLSIRHLDDTPTYGHITAGYTVSRQAIFTVPAGYTGYMTSSVVSASAPNDVKVQSARVINRTNENSDLGFNTGCIMYPKSEIVVTNETIVRQLEIPSRVIEKSDMIASGQGFTGFSGAITTIMRGYLKLNE